MANQIARLKSSLANSKMQKENNALYQTVLGLINSLEATELKASRAISLSGSGGGSGSNITLSDLFPAAMLLMGGVNRNNSSSSSASSDPFPQIMMLMGGGNKNNDESIASVDYVVMSDGVEPPTPLSDGFGNFIYIPYSV